MESLKRYISDETVKSFINVPFMSHLYFKKDIVKQIKAKGFTIILKGLYRKLVLF